MHENETELIKQARGGDRDAFVVLVKDCMEQVARIPYYILGNREQAEEVTQEAFLKAFTKLSQLADDVPFKNWVSRIAKNLSIDILRKRILFQKFQRNGLSEEVDTDKEIVLDVRRALMKIPVNQRLPLTLEYYDGLKMEDISQITGVPIGTIKSRIHAAKKKLKELLSDKL
ncbi:MAG TPA: RNA polymerase sigma factor [Caldisericia bacterium]|nr:RNA polymerase sigma factor [Caldisericia bacterium]HPF49599.1 RNA polymerase sigma factor [Caldisericia bacterium]HPI84485.1 RNA polymerase sigma factor [Caldisericia bacterium]HPQ93851.1 RNA polymerase sigma factor [Caldisericia bacterium]HRV75396.1 RNA polymerase sigma factor [Caldisericia bacterium]